MKAIIMAGGEGNRLRPLTSNRPKPMVPVLNKPVLEHAINLLRKKGITDITLSLFYLPENVQNYFGDGSEWEVNITYSIEESPLGTAGGVKHALPHPQETVLVLSGDGIVDFDIDTILNFHREKKSQFTVVLTRVKEPTEYGIVILHDDGRIDKFFEKPAWSEVFSDTVNTGMYIIEPEIIERYIPENEKFDFSLDLFPLLAKKEIPLYGFVAEGYWCDVGNLNAYCDVHLAILAGRVKIDFPGKKIGENVWVGKNVEIAPGAIVQGPAVLGNFVRVKSGAQISEFTVIGDNCIIGEGTSVRRSIILHNTVIGPKSELRGAIVGKRCVLESGVSIFEGAIISDDCQIGEGAEIPPGIRVWPEKIIEQGVKLTSDLIWGQSEKKTLFSAEGIAGPFNIKITPEFGAKLGSAIGAHLGKNSTVVISRDTTSASRLIKRAISSGLLSMGVQVFDMEIEAIPINRYSTRFVGADLGIYVQVSPLTGLQSIQIKIFNGLGFQISLAEERKIENIFFRGDYPRKDAFEVGRVEYPIHHIDSYISHVTGYIDQELLRKRRFNIIIDCFYGATARVFPDLLAGFGCVPTVLRGQMKEFLSIEELRSDTRRAIDTIIAMAKANREIGAIIGPHGEYISIIDEEGGLLSSEDVNALLCVYYLKHRREKIINVPVTSSAMIEQIAASYEGRVQRTSTKLRAPQDIEDIFLDNTTGRYPYLEKDYDPMISFLIILQYAAMEGKSIAALRKELPRSNLYRTSLPCTIDEKAALMRSLATLESSGGAKVETMDGVRIIKEGAWILILPDSRQPLLHVYAEGETTAARDAIIDEFTRIIKNNQKHGE